MNKPQAFGTDPKFHEFRRLMSQAITLQQQGQFAAAENIYARILSQTPDQPDVLHFLGLLKHQSGNSAEAVRLMQKSLELGLPNAGYLYNLGNVLQQMGAPLEAARHLQQAVDLMSTNAAAWNRLGECQEDLGMHFKAVESYRKSYSLEPDSLPHVLNLARGLHNTGEFTEAAETCARYLQKHPDDPDVAFAEINSLLAAERPEEALEKARAALRADPLSARFHHVLGMLLAKLGKFSEAQEHYEKALKIDPQFHAASFSLSSIKRFEADDPMVAALEKRLEQSPPQEPTTRAFAEFALGKMRDDQHEYDRAFAHFQQGNKLIRSMLKYSTSAVSMYMDSLIKHLGPDFVSARGHLGSDTDKPIFIVGMMRSGTSLVEQILAAHPQVAAGGEMAFLSQAVRSQTESVAVVTGDKIAALSDEQLTAISRHYLEKVAEYAPEAARITDKLPGNFLIVGLIRTLFPNARIIHCTRDPLDTCLSCYFTHFDAVQPYTYDLTEVGEYYQMYHRMMEAHGAIVDERSLLTVSYEELVRDFEKGARRMVEFCGLEWDPRCLEFMRVERVVSTASLYQVRQAPYQHSVGRWKHYAAHIEPLQKALAGLTQ